MECIISDEFCHRADQCLKKLNKSTNSVEQSEAGRDQGASEPQSICMLDVYEDPLEIEDEMDCVYIPGRMLTSYSYSCICISEHVGASAMHMFCVPASRSCARGGVCA